MDGVAGLLDVAGTRGAAGNGVHDMEGPNGFFCDPTGKAEGGRRVEAGGPLRHVSRLATSGRGEWQRGVGVEAVDGRGGYRGGLSTGDS